MLLKLLKKIIESNKEIESLINNLLRHENLSLSTNQLIVLYNIKEFELPSLEKQSIGAMHHNLEKLINIGLIIKDSNYHNDKRRVKFEITEKGKDIINKINNIDKKIANRINKRLINEIKHIS